MTSAGRPRRPRRRAQALAVLERGAAGDVELVEDVQQLEPVALARGFDPFALLDGRGEGLHTLAARGLRHPDDPDGVPELPMLPQADTPGCTVQACGVRDHLPDYTKAGVTVLGVSPDPVKAVKKFHEGQELNFKLLADADHAVCEAYGVWVEKSMYGRTYWGAQRSTFVIDEDGVVAHVVEKVSPKTHDEEVLAKL